ncbi:MAG: ADP-ribose pyrophosphatase [Methanosaeta sp. PtaU1.Bin112]|nr:MAG: ADP-ribose pyrophosphatase [Methanosaeta sp. PtaU1.Bin112]
MTIAHRIAAGGIVIREGRVLLVRYRDGKDSYLVAPGGAIEDCESLATAAEREIAEETGVKCAALWPVMIENLRASRYQMVKVWYLCDCIDGAASCMAPAKEEGIIEVGWYGDSELENETVYPEIIKTLKIAAISRLKSEIIDHGVRRARF